MGVSELQLAAMMHGCRRSRSTGGGGGTVQVKGYRRANGTYVAGYTRSLPRKTSSTTPTTSGKRTSCASAVQVVSPAASSSGCSNRKTVYVRGYTKSNGTYVAGYFRSPPSSKGGSNSRSAANPHSSCASTSSVAGNCNSPASPHCPSNAKIVHVTGHTKSMANSTHVMSHIRLPPRITVKSVQVVPASRVTRSSQPPGTIIQDTNTQVSKSTKFESTTKGDTDKMHPPVRRPRSDNIKPTESDLGKIPGKDILKQNPVSKLCNAMPTALVNVEAVIKQHPTARPDSVKSSDSETIQAKSEDVFKQRSPSLDVKGKQDCRSDEEVAQGKIIILYQ